MPPFWHWLRRYVKPREPIDYLLYILTSVALCVSLATLVTVALRACRL